MVLCGAAFEYTDAGGQTPAFSSVPLDDAWIHFVYAKSLATSLSLDYNPGQSEAGFTSMLWVILLAPFLLLRVPAPLAAKIIGLASHIGLAWLLYLLIRKHVPRYVAAVAPLLLAVAPVFTFSALSGMEVSVYAFVMMAGAYAFFESQYKTCGVFLALTALARPDGVIFVGLVWAFFLAGRLFSRVNESRGKQPSWADGAWIFGLPILAGLSWMVFCWAATGRPFPTAYYVRAGGFAFFSNFDRIGQILAEIGHASFTTGHFAKALFILAGIAFIVMKKEYRLYLAFIFPPIFMFLMGGDVVQVIGGTFMGNRYLVPALPFILALQVFGIGLVVMLAQKLLERSRASKYILPAIAVILGVALLFPFTGYKKHCNDMREEFAWSCSNIDEMQVSIGKWIDESTPKDAVVATFDAGAIRYFGDRSTLDILSLNTHDIPPNDPATVRMHANYLVTYPVHSKVLVEPYLEKEVHRVTLKKNVACAAETMVVYQVK